MSESRIYKARRLFARKVFVFLSVLALVAMPVSGTAMPRQEGCLPPPAFVRAAVYPDGNVYVEWQFVEGAESYTIHVFSDDTGFWEPITGVTENSLWTHVPCSPAAWFRVKVKGTYPGCEGLYNEDWFYEYCF
jgi:hypothetical protein